MSNSTHALRRYASLDACCACTHYLVFKEPDLLDFLTAAQHFRAWQRASPPTGRYGPFLGEPLRLAALSLLVKPLTPVRRGVASREEDLPQRPPSQRAGSPSGEPC